MKSANLPGDSFNLSIEFLFFYKDQKFKEIVEKIHKFGYLVKVFMVHTFTHMESPETYQRLMDAGVDCIITESPEKVKAFNESS